MTPQQFVAVGVRLAAIWVGIHSLRFLTSVPTFLAASDQAYRLPQTLLYGGSLLLIAGAMWLFPQTIARKLLPHAASNQPMSLSAVSAARVGCVLIGLWLLVKKFYVFASLGFTALLTANYSISEEPLYSKVDLIVSACEVVLGLFLVLRSDLFARAIGSERSFPD